MVRRVWNFLSDATASAFPECVHERVHTVPALQWSGGNMVHRSIAHQDVAGVGLNHFQVSLQACTPFRVACLTLQQVAV